MVLCFGSPRQLIQEDNPQQRWIEGPCKQIQIDLNLKKFFFNLLFNWWRIERSLLFWVSAWLVFALNISHYSLKCSCGCLPVWFMPSPLACSSPCLRFLPSHAELFEAPFTALLAHGLTCWSSFFSLLHPHSCTFMLPWWFLVSFGFSLAITSFGAQAL